MAASGADDAVPRRKPLGLIPGWGAIRAAKLHRLRKAAPPSRPKPSAHPQAVHLAWVRVCCEKAGLSAPDPTTLAAALDMLDGTVTDMDSPDKRHLALALAGAATALSGHRAHLICLAEATAARLREITEKVCAACDVTSALISDEARIDERAEGHTAQVVVASAARFGQDRLRDQALLGGRARGSRARVGALAAGMDTGSLIRGAPLAFVDDADLVMIEAPRSLGFNADPEEDADRLRAEEAFAVLRGLAPGDDYQVDQTTRRIRLTTQGEGKLDLAAALFEGPWLRRAWREETILAALTIRDFFQPGKDYTVQEDQVVLARTPSTSTVEPGIEALIAAKENVAARSTLSGLWSYRSFLSSYRHLAGTGFATAGLSHEIMAAYGLDVRGRTAVPSTDPPQVTDARGRADALRVFPAPAIFWAPTPKDTRQAGADPKRTVVAEQVFALPSPPEMLVQIAAALPRWEQRLHQSYPDTEVHRFVTVADGAFDTLDEGARELNRFRETPNLGLYRAVQGAMVQASARQRAAHLKSDRYFERILAFTGDGP